MSQVQTQIAADLIEWADAAPRLAGNHEALDLMPKELIEAAVAIEQLFAIAKALAPSGIETDFSVWCANYQLKQHQGAFK